ncbi:MAG TPA: SDR family oxidoreductase [Ardenticatenaceae bacterium]|jgi:NAD(P)-dependent dehydrogenase (short-subunit alcohol dehydrogenase family)
MNTAQPMQGKVCMVTGATAGIGKETAKELARLGATVVIVGRSEEKSRATVTELRQQSGNASIEYILADLSVQEQIRQLAETFKSRHQRLDVLVNNAGAVMMSRQESKEGIEMTFALNHLNYFLLTMLLLDVLKASAPSRVINVSSGAHLAGRINFDDPQFARGYSGWRAYAQSKFANVLFTYELARRLEGTGVTANALHPGFVASNFIATNNGRWARLVRPIVQLAAISVAQGAETSTYLASSPEVEGVTGKYFEKKRAIASSGASYNEEVARRLWELSEQMTGLQVAAKVKL